MTSRPLSILVTGGAGYIGSAIVRRLAAAGHRPSVLDLQPAGGDLVAGAPSSQADVQDEAAVSDALDRYRPDAVIHVAGVKSVAESTTNPARYFATNTAGTLSVLRAMVRHDVRRFIFSSSAAVYGSRATSPITEDALTLPDNPYGESKLLAERLLPWFEQAHGISWLALRYFNAAGASADGRFGESWDGAVNLIPVALRALATGRPMSVFGSDWPTPDGTAIRDYVHVDDLAEGHLAAVEALVAGGPSATVNLGTGRGASVQEVLDGIERVSGQAVPAVRVDRRPGDPPAVWADASRAQALLGWRATRELGSILTDAWRFASNHDATGSTR